MSLPQITDLIHAMGFRDGMECVRIVIGQHKYKYLTAEALVEILVELIKNQDEEISKLKNEIEGELK